MVANAIGQGSKSAEKRKSKIQRRHVYTLRNVCIPPQENARVHEDKARRVFDELCAEVEDGGVGKGEDGKIEEVEGVNGAHVSDGEDPEFNFKQNRHGRGSVSEGVDGHKEKEDEHDQGEEGPAEVKGVGRGNG